ncbi:DNA excision repair protein ERCC-1 [Pangasianodon hypophthalmus]|uniref:DNA excision repair protein ERCC-1 n=1 Tax=Pangasianodon hypophthalmus TaxID=310915 RepID=UPI000EFFD4F5|nr:DNA excision repair protein ERCC-1 [Pangasianodon hypophthalmus]
MLCATAGRKREVLWRPLADDYKPCSLWPSVFLQSAQRLAALQPVLFVVHGAGVVGMEKNKKFKINLDDSAFNRERSPVASLFKPSSKGGNAETSTTHSAPQAGGQPLSYAEFVVQSKSRAKERPGPQTGDLPQDVLRAAGQRSDVALDCGSVTKPSTDAGKTQTSTKGRRSPEPTIARSETSAVPGRLEEDLGQGQKMDEDQSTEECTVTPQAIGSGNSIIVSPRQRGNPILKFVRSVPWEFGEVVPDYVLGRTTCALFLSVRYHTLNPNYIHERLKQLGQAFTLRVLLVQVDVKDPHHALNDLARICIMADCTLILAWSPEEAGRYLETYKSYEKKPADLLKEQVEKDYLSKVTDCLTTVKSINKTDAITLLSTFSSLGGIINASKEELVLCPGLGPQKARRLYDVLHQPFLKSKKKEST